MDAAKWWFADKPIGHRDPRELRMNWQRLQPVGRSAIAAHEPNWETAAWNGTGVPSVASISMLDELA
jgi:hypothetical protein